VHSATTSTPGAARGRVRGDGSPSEHLLYVRPLARRTDAKVDEFLDAINATVIAIDRPTARLAAALRRRHRSLRLPDALSLAAAIAADVQLLTLDTRDQRECGGRGVGCWR
jgi:predicted nucleic acid-binding protein